MKEFYNVYLRGIKKEKKYNRNLYDTIDEKTGGIYNYVDGMLGTNEITESIKQENRFLDDEIPRPLGFNAKLGLYKQASVLLAKTIMVKDFLTNMEKIKGNLFKEKIEDINEQINLARINFKSALDAVQKSM